MPVTSLSRTVLLGAVALALIAGTCALNWNSIRPALKGVGMDWWALPELLALQAKSQEAVTRVSRVHHELNEVAHLRDKLVGEILEEKKSVFEGFVEFSTLCTESPSLSRSVEVLFPAETTERSIRLYFSHCLKTAAEDRPAVLVRLMPDIQNLSSPCQFIPSRVRSES